MSDREVTCNQAVEEIPNNRISTSKYTVLSFLPKNLAFQLMKMANMYFLVTINLLPLLKKIFPLLSLLCDKNIKNSCK